MNSDETSVLLIQFTPGIKVEMWRTLLSALPQVRTVVFEGYSYGTGPDDMVQLVEEFSPDTIFFMTSQMRGKEVNLKKYNSGRQYEEAGVIALDGIDAISASQTINRLTEEGKTKDEIAEHMKQLAEESRRQIVPISPTPLP